MFMIKLMSILIEDNSSFTNISVPKIISSSSEDALSHSLGRTVWEMNYFLIEVSKRGHFWPLFTFDYLWIPFINAKICNSENMHMLSVFNFYHGNYFCYSCRWIPCDSTASGISLHSLTEKQLRCRDAQSTFYRENACKPRHFLQSSGGFSVYWFCTFTAGEWSRVLFPLYRGTAGEDAYSFFWAHPLSWVWKYRRSSFIGFIRRNAEFKTGNSCLTLWCMSLGLKCSFINHSNASRHSYASWATFAIHR